MTSQSISVVILSADLISFNEIRAALAEDGGAKLLSGSNDAEPLHDENVRLKPAAAVSGNPF